MTPRSWRLRVRQCHVSSFASHHAQSPARLFMPAKGHISTSLPQPMLWLSMLPQCVSAAIHKLTYVCRQRHTTANNAQHYADVMYGYYTALYQGTGGAAPEHALEVELARRDQQVQDRSAPL